VESACSVSERLWIGTSAFVIKYQEFEPAILGDIEKPKSKAKPQKDEELWVVQLADKIEDMFATCGRGHELLAEGIAGRRVDFARDP